MYMTPSQQVSLSNSCAPTTYNFLMPWWDDLDDISTDPNQGICYATRGTAPNRRFIVQWNNIGNFAYYVGDPTITFQVVLYETTNEIHFVYEDATFGSPETSDDGGGGATVGIIGPTTDPTYYEYSCNTNSVSDGQCIAFLPPEASPCAVTCPANITVDNDPGSCDAYVTVPAPTLSECASDAVVTNDFNGTEDASGTYPIGETEVEFTIQETNSAPVTCTFTVNVTNTQGIELECPGDMAFTLDPGDCEAFPLWDTPVAFSCSGFGGPPATLATVNNTNNGGSSGGMVFFDVTNNSNIDLHVTEMSAKISNATVINIYIKAGTYVGYTGTSSAWTLAYSANVTTGPFDGTYPGTNTLTPFTTDFYIPTGDYAIAFHTVSAAQNYTNGDGTNQSFSDGTLDINLGASYNYAWPTTTFSPRIWNGSITYGTSSFTQEATQTTGPASGEGFPIGVTTVTYTATDFEGNTAECSFDVTVNNYPNPTSTLACNDLVQVSVDEDCEAEINADMILEGGPYSCYDDYRVEIFTSMPAVTYNAVGNVSNPVGPGHYVVGVYDQTGNNCWGEINVLDKLPPVLECRDVAVDCEEGANSVDEPAPAVVGYQQQIEDGLSDVVDDNSFDYDFDYSYLPAGTPALDVNLRLKLTGHTYLPDLVVTLTAPDGTSADIMTIGGCTGQEWPIDCWFDDDGASITQCVELNCDACSLAPLAAGYSTPTILTGFEGLDASGVWTVTVADTYSGDDGVIEIVGLEIEVNLPQVLPYDGCGDFDLSYTDSSTDYYCESTAQVVERTWTAVDEAGNSSSCVQTISVLAPEITDYAWPLNWDGLTNIGNYPMLECDGSYALDASGNPSPAYTGWPANGNDYCGTLEIFYTDAVYHLTCGEKILRYWTVVNDCTGEVFEHTQVIRIDDNTAPTFMVGEDLTAHAKAYECLSDFEVPAIMHLSDNCDSSPKWWVTTTAGSLSGDLNYNGYVDADETWYATNIPLGTYDLCYHAIDNCGNETVECVTLTVEDGVPPIPVCEQYKQVSLTAAGSAKVFAEDFDSGSFDNCGPVWFKVLRVNNDLVYDGGCEDLNGDDNLSTSAIDVWYDDDVYFCCDDLAAGDVMVSMRVFDVDPGDGPVAPSRMVPGGDLYGHYNDCWSIVHVECKIPPSLTCENVTVTCEESLDPEENTSLYPSVLYVCSLDALDYTDSRNNGVCGASVTRTWTATACGKTTTCKQTITIEGTEAFDPCTIVFPADKSATCASELPDGGEPTWTENPCNVVTAEIVNEDTFKFVDGACYKIVRDWAVIDWCVYEANTGAEMNVDAVTSARKLNCNELVEDGYYRYTQVLMITDNVPPSIDVVDQCVGTTDCYAYDVTLNATASDSCNTNEKFNWKYIVTNMDTWETVQYSYNYTPVPTQGTKGSKTKDKLDGVKESKLVVLDALPIGNYKVTWTVGDGCGNATSKDQYFTVADKKAPTPVMVDIATAVMQNGMVELKARWFDKGGCGDGCISCYDNCTTTDGLYFTFTPMLPDFATNPDKWAQQYATYGRYFFDPETGAISTEAKYLAGTAHAWYPESRSSSRVFLCEYVEEANYSTTIPVYVWDQFALNEECDDNNYDYANVVVNFNHCGTSPLVSGTVKAYSNNESILNMNMLAQSETNDEYKFNVNSDENGAYEVSVIQDDVYDVSGTKDIDYANGVTTLDLVLIQKYLLGLKSFNDPFMLVAADMNKDGKVTASDLSTGRSLILGKTSSFENHSWITINTDYAFNDATKAASESDAASMIAVSVAESNVSGVNFSALKIGDVNFSAEQIEGRTSNGIKLMLDDATVKTGEEVEIPFYAEDFTGVYGTQFVLEMNGMTLESVQSGALTMDESNYQVRGREVLVSWNDANGVNVENGTVLFTLKVKSNVESSVRNMITISDNGLRSEIYTGEDLEIKSLKIAYRNTNDTYALYQNQPNPFVESTTIGFDLPKSAEYTLTVYDVTGKQLVVRTNVGEAGYNTEVITNKEVTNSGVLYYRIESGDYTATKKMVMIK
ncbi:MAG: HYR domain-containing protein [Saprospiraceae bacterium]